jgi:hypothetical protein
MLLPRSGKAQMEEVHLRSDNVGLLVLQDFQEQGELSDFNGLGIDIYAINVRQKDASLFSDREAPFPIVGWRSSPCCASRPRSSCTNRGANPADAGTLQ